MAYPLNDPEFKKLTRDYLWIDPISVDKRKETEKELLTRQWLHFLQPKSPSNPQGFDLDILVEMVENGPLHYRPELGRSNPRLSAINHLSELGFADYTVHKLSFEYMSTTLLGGFMYCHQFGEISSLVDARLRRVRQLEEKQNGQ